MLNVELDFQFKFVLRERDTCHNPWGRITTKFKANISEGLRITKVKALSFIKLLIGSMQLIFDELHFRKSKGPAQSQHVILVYRYFEDGAKGRWDLISNREMDFLRRQ